MRFLLVFIETESDDFWQASTHVDGQRTKAKGQDRHKKEQIVKDYDDMATNNNASVYGLSGR